MSCYTHRLKGDLAERGVTLTPENRKAVDAVIREQLGGADERCPEVWSRVKGAREDEAAREALMDAIVEALGS